MLQYKSIDISERNLKMAKKITALLLALVLCIAVTGCSRDDAPDGMYLVSSSDEPFKLYVPDSWASNSSSGISGAFISGSANIAVSARYFAHENANATLESYTAEYIASCAAGLEQFNLAESTAALIGGENATQLIYTVMNGEESFKFSVYIVKYADDFVLLSMHAPADMYDEYSPQFSKIVDAFVLCQKGDAVNDCVTDSKTPEGMKIASSDVVEYRLYVPTAWICDSQSEKSEAYFPESGKPNVTVTSYSPSEEMTAEEYFRMCENEYRQSLDGYELISALDRAVGSRAAKCYTYSVNAGGARVRIMQTVMEYSGLVYSITYTALEERFDNHMEDVNAMLDAFRFR